MPPIRFAVPRLFLLLSTTVCEETEQIDYLRDIQGLFHSHCYDCHGESWQEAGLRLDSVEGIHKGSVSGLVVIPGNSLESRLIQRIG